MGAYLPRLRLARATIMPVTIRIAAADRSAASSASSPRIALDPPADITEPNEPADMAEPADAAEPTERAEAADPIDPIESTEP